MTSADLRDKGPRHRFTSSKQVDEIVSCVAEQWTRRSGTTSVVPRDKGKSISLTYQVYSDTVNAVTIDVEDTGASRDVTVFAGKGDDNKKLQDELGACLS
ncbi:hypothetical protein [Sphingomonas sanxanigenens]|uniref:Uncharacterized protein n=1 Tax=Sphingomonas sanxanigenens DSM 19645 = NX02 TaxID=1123269 RepID=W0ALH1_9SPHN|nr:hypothetical protein [Sphingomonas sanxanigenens]AHE57437.1 hypothetical protein NX02_29365 [Sphingomonas sanxanigenens DSM 19645 = NX02]